MLFDFERANVIVKDLTLITQSYTTDLLEDEYDAAAAFVLVEYGRIFLLRV